MDVTDAFNEFPASLAELPLDVAKKTLEKTEKANNCCSEGRNCLFYAVLRPDEDEACELSRLILEDEIVARDHVDCYGQTALFYAAREGHSRCVEMLVQEFFFDVSHVDGNKQTALFYAARDGRTETLQFLVDHGADINHIDTNGDTPIFYAARDGRAETVHKMLELGADCSIRNKKKSYASTIARKHGCKELAADLDARRKSQQQTAATKVSEPPDAPVSARGGRRARRPATRAAAARQKRPPPREAESPAPKRRLRRRTSYAAVSDSVSEIEAESASPIALAAASASDPKPPTNNEPPSLLLQTSEASSPATSLPSPPPPIVQPPAEPAEPPPPPPPIIPDMPRISYTLQFLGPDRLWTFATPAKVREFEALFPQLAVWNRTVPLPEIGLDDDPFRAQWHRLALKLINHMLEGGINGAWLFAQPVDPKEWDIKDYFSVVKKPMDFSTIRNNLLMETHYRTISSFWDDLQLVFYNCILYNSATSNVGEVCLTVQKACSDFADDVGISRLLDEERPREAAAQAIADEILGPEPPPAEEAPEVEMTRPASGAEVAMTTPDSGDPMITDAEVDTSYQVMEDVAMEGDERSPLSSLNSLTPTAAVAPAMLTSCIVEDEEIAVGSNSAFSNNPNLPLPPSLLDGSDLLMISPPCESEADEEMLAASPQKGASPTLSPSPNTSFPTSPMTGLDEAVEEGEVAAGEMMGLDTPSPTNDYMDKGGRDQYNGGDVPTTDLQALDQQSPRL